MPTLTNRQPYIYYETLGDVALPPLLIIAGITDYTAKCQWQASALSDDFPVILFDNRGAGRSETPQPGYTMDDMADDAAAVLDTLDIDSAHVFGFSMGGMIAQHFALRYPQRVRRLVLGCTIAGGALTVQPEEQVVTALMNPLSTGDRRQDFYAGMWISLSDACITGQLDIVERLADLAAENPQTPIGYAGQMQAVLSHDVSDSLDEIHAPTLVLHGEADRLIPPENGRLLAAAIPGARFIPYPAAGH
nr:alpha/beta fold hydrolase [Promineifilum sp.]